jgi:biopolymer transport protein ExbB/TolQ
MFNLARAERRASRLLKGSLDIGDLYDELEALRDSVQALSARAGQSASRRYDRARDSAAETWEEAEEAMKDHLAASLLLAVGLGLVIGYFIRRGTE